MSCLRRVTQLPPFPLPNQSASLRRLPQVPLPSPHRNGSESVGSRLKNLVFIHFCTIIAVPALPSKTRNQLLAYVAMANDLAQRPRFYNTLTANCTTLVSEMVHTVHPGLPLDSR